MSQQEPPSTSRPLRRPKPPGRRWWAACTVLHLLCAVTFAVGAWAGLHWLERVGTDSYYQAHKDADPDIMMMLEGLVLLLVAGCVLAVAYALVGFALSLAHTMVGPVMLLASSMCTWVVAPFAVGELWPDGGALCTLVALVALVTTPTGVVASCIAMCRPQRRRAPAGAVAAPAYATPLYAAPPYAPPPYLRAPGTLTASPRGDSGEDRARRTLDGS